MATQSHDIRQIAQDLYPTYDQLEPLGQGGMGDLFKGRKTGLNVPVVVKIIKSKLKGRMDERQEAEILKGLKHKYLPRIYDVIENKDGYLYTIMDYIPGENLKDYIKKNGVADQKTVFRWAQQLCEVVAYLHEQTPAIIHSDIKPGNVMITPHGDICLIDFNTSMELRAGLTAIGKTKGYAAPEQYTKPEQVIKEMQVSAGLYAQPEQETILTPGGDGTEEETVFLENTDSARSGTSTKSPDTGSGSSLSSRFFHSSAVSTAATQSGKKNYYGTVTRRTDVYAIGATLYFALTATDPPHSLEPPRPLSTFRLPVSRSLVQIIERAMEKNPQDRFCDAAEMGKALQDIHRLDGNFRKARLLTIAGVLLELGLLLGGIALMVAGSAQLQKEQVNSYVQLLNDAQQEKGRGHYAEALALTQQAQTLMDTRMEAYAEEAAIYFSQGSNAVSKEERDECFKHCTTTVQEILLTQFPGGSAAEWGKVYFVGAESCVELEDYALARKWYRKAIQNDPSESYYRGLISACVFDADMDGAKDVLEEMRTALPNSSTEAVYALMQAELCFLEKDYTGAVRHYKELFQATNEEAMLRRGYLAANNACIYGGNAFLSQGIAFLEEACQRLPSAWGVFKPLLANNYYAQSYLDEESNQDLWLEKSLEAFSCVGAEFLSMDDRLTMNQIRILLDQLEAAQTDLLAMRALYPDHYQVHMRLSYLYLSKYASSGNLQDRQEAEKAYWEAKTCYEESQAIDPEMIAFLSIWQQYL